VLVALLILRSAWTLLLKSTRILMEDAPDSVDPVAVRSTLIANVPGIRDVHDVHCWSLTTGQTMLTLHVALETGASPADVLRAAKRVLIERFEIAHSALQIEHAECPDEV
jgi:cobalt-zinc-cadmium efflux system protein